MQQFQLVDKLVVHRYINWIFAIKVWCWHPNSCRSYRVTFVVARIWYPDLTLFSRSDMVKAISAASLNSRNCGSPKKLYHWCGTQMNSRDRLKNFRSSPFNGWKRDIGSIKSAHYTLICIRLTCIFTELMCICHHVTVTW